MKKIKVELTGETPLLMHSVKGMEQPKAKKNPAKQYDPKIDAEKVAYRNEKGELVIPSRCIKACFVNGASWYKFGNKSAKPIIAGACRINPTEVVIKNKGKILKNYTIDIRPVVVQRARIMRARPRLDAWTVEFEIVYNEQLISDTEIMKEILSESGQRIGLLDNRPQKYGENGCFEITKWKVS